ncbi:hypothetical protein PV721_23400 [Streptomyces sp. MB09-01]|uniref:hypothetical protein n=1 Tax=Streptomyces sp. MB09-01 TaxID=3028666 RepID=UPI00299FA79C|nr:hypothetical protein [Streptomyces sp. MB09-01]MDX3537267.1 hypothetical protein [Streptomyces sp. MB09-01]
MAENAGPMMEATLYEAPHYEGPAVAVPPDKGNEGGEAVAYSLAHLGLNRLGSLRAPTLPADPDDLFRQELRWVTTVTVWESRPDSWMADDGERGKAWQDYGADTTDLGAWAAKVRYVRVWKQTADALTDADSLLHDAAPIAIVIVE